MASIPAPLVGFKRLNSLTYIYEPPTTITTVSSSTPELILLATWLDAAPRYIAKYTRGYQSLYPSARILLLTTALADYFSFPTRAAEAARLEPALSLLTSLPANTGILLHSFSNGGTGTASLLARLYLARTGNRMPINAQFLDSAPGSGDYGRTVTALTLSLPKSPPVLYYVSLVMLHIFLAAYYGFKKATGGKNNAQVLRDGLLDTKVWDSGVSRCYIYGKADKMIGWGDVLEHARMAKERGWERVWTEEFEGSAHCGHMLVDERRYWGIVEAIWGEQ